MSLKTRNTLELRQGNTKLRLIVDDANSRVGIWIGSTEIARMTATAFTPLVDAGIGGGDLDLGSSGAAGSLDIFPATASKGKLRFTAVDNAGDTTSEIKNAAQSAAAVWTIPDTNGNDTFDMLGLAQTITGIKSFAAMFRIQRSATVAAAGSVQGDAAALSEGFQTVSGANGTLGVRLPTAVAGAVVIIKGITNGVLKVWPATGAAINGLGSNNAMSLASGLIPAIFIADTTTQWYTIPLLPS